MIAPTDFEVMVLVTALVVLSLVYSLVKFAWKQPLQNGPGYFLGIEVPAGFYDGPGKRWLTGYRAILVALHLALAVALALCFAFKRWDLIPLWCGGFALVYVPALFTLNLWTRHKLGARPPVRAVALSLESRRLGDYISWPIETLYAVIIAACWWLLLRRGLAIDWLPPLQMTWAALILPGKIALVRSGAPLPAERAEEHYRYQDAMRRNAIRALNAWGWLMLVTLCGFPLRLIWPPASLPALVWIFLAVFTAVFLCMMIVIYRGMRLAATMGRNLLPAGSWMTPFRRVTRQMNRFYLIWCAIWVGGILVLNIYSLCR
jgi:preprotein translocase subunit SecG